VTFVFTESQETGKAVLCKFRSGTPVPAIRYDIARELMVAIHKIKREPNLEIRFDGGKPTTEVRLTCHKRLKCRKSGEMRREKP
jgi:hypothetical protein